MKTVDFLCFNNPNIIWSFLENLTATILNSKPVWSNFTSSYSIQSRSSFQLCSSLPPNYHTESTPEDKLSLLPYKHQTQHLLIWWNKKHPQGNNFVELRTFSSSFSPSSSMLWKHARILKRDEKKCIRLMKKRRENSFHSNTTRNSHHILNSMFIHS